MSIREEQGLTGQQFGNYRIERESVFGRDNGVYLAQDLKEGRPFFLAVAETSAKEDPGLAWLFERRMEAVAQLKHPYIATVEDLGATPDGQPYAAIAYHEGKTLAQHLEELDQRRVRMSPFEALNLVGQIADALSVAHPAGIIHHDLRPENILVDENNAPILIDLGIPIGTGAPKTADEILRTGILDYASPEQLEGESLSVQSNIYSLGILLYKLLTGHRPQIPKSSWDIFEHRGEEFPRPIPLEEILPGLSAETYHVVKNCLWQETWNRFETTAELIDAIELAKDAEYALEIREASGQSYLRWAFVATSVLLLTLLAVFLLARGGDDDPEQTPTRRPPTAVPGLATSSMSGIIEELITATPPVTPSPTATATDIPTPVLGPVELLGPRPESEIRSGDEVTFSWLWSSPLETDQQFAVYVIIDDESVLLDTVIEPESNDRYILQATAGEDLPVGSYFWQVVLEDLTSQQELTTSDLSAITIRPEMTPTVEPTNTVAASVTPTPSPTPAEECQIVPPPGWVSYNVRSGDTLFDLAVSTGTTIARLRQVNCMESNVLSVGESLWLPSSPATSTPVITPTNTPGGSGPPPPPPPPATRRPTPTPPSP